MKRTKGNLERGITLVALIITIIVMLILVAVTVTVLVDSDIIGKSEEAGALYQSAYANEGAKVSNETIEGEVRHNTVEGYLQDICEHNIVDGKCTKCDFELIKFTIEGTEYMAEPGMTWEEWIDSDYSKGEFEVYADNPMFVCCTGTEEEMVMRDITGGWLSSQAVKTNEEITEYSYYTWPFGEGPMG